MITTQNHQRSKYSVRWLCVLQKVFTEQGMSAIAASLVVRWQEQNVCTGNAASLHMLLHWHACRPIMLNSLEQLGMHWMRACV